jgi:hypothetical protein
LRWISPLISEFRAVPKGGDRGSVSDEQQQPIGGRRFFAGYLRYLLR